ncbi:hypothetical protein OC195_19335 [Priestia flexa]|nr:hypothetical protein OC195_19335 [Priestia flexa]
MKFLDDKEEAVYTEQVEFYNVTLDELLKKQSSTEQVAEDKSESELYEEEKEADDLKAPSDPGFVVGTHLNSGERLFRFGCAFNYTVGYRFRYYGVL